MNGLRSVNSLMKKALQQEGSRDVSSILFVSLARACGLGARLVHSLQAIPWRAEKVVAKKKSGAGSKKRLLAHRQGNGSPAGSAASEEEGEDDEMEEVPMPEDREGGPGYVASQVKRKGIRGAGKRRLQDPADLYRLRKQRPTPRKLGDEGPKRKTKEGKLICTPALRIADCGDLSHQPPVFWAEVFSRSDQRWIPVDPVRGTIRKKTHFEPQSDNGPIRMSYVVAFEEGQKTAVKRADSADGFARDVTLRYTKNFGAKTVKLRVPVKKDEQDWWEEILAILHRPQHLVRWTRKLALKRSTETSWKMPSSKRVMHPKQCLFTCRASKIIQCALGYVFW